MVDEGEKEGTFDITTQDVRFSSYTVKAYNEEDAKAKSGLFGDGVNTFHFIEIDVLRKPSPPIFSNICLLFFYAHNIYIYHIINLLKHSEN